MKCASNGPSSKTTVLHSNKPEPTHTATHHTLINRLSELEGIVIQGASEAAAYTSKWLVIPRSSPQQPDNEN